MLSKAGRRVRRAAGFGETPQPDHPYQGEERERTVQGREDERKVDESLIPREAQEEESHLCCKEQSQAEHGPAHLREFT